ncbi:hypothetical protein CLCR_06812 [Cladophialophora carrionii]|uniref:DUF6590 domain-containing protein n=1 Tax=Cladophialophora carrionii TaxID=86049 RepID=A0A1C1CM51_9EURO|nr:hypothetical protein CLCR_06812 [Cladophialophora carrionii]
MAPFDPVERYGGGWKIHDDGRESRVLRVVIKDVARRDLNEINHADDWNVLKDVVLSRNLDDGNIKHRFHKATNCRLPLQARVQHRTRLLLRLQHHIAGYRSEHGGHHKTPNKSDLLLDFIAIKYGELEECNAFIKQHRRILDVDPQALLNSAVQSRRNADDLRTLRCVQRYVILKACKSRNARERDDYLHHLGGEGEEGKEDRVEYARDLKQTLDFVSHLLKANPTASRESTLSASRNQGSGNDQMNMRDQSQQSNSVPGLPVPSYRAPAMSSTATYETTASFSSYGQQTSRVQSNQTSGEALGRTFPHPSGTTAPFMPVRHNSGRGDCHVPAAPSVPISRARTNSEHGNKATHDQSGSRGTGVSYAHPPRECQPGRNRSTLPTVGGLNNVEFRGLPQLQVADTELLDANYTLRDDAKTFFSEGRVFSMMFHENLGLKRGFRGTLQPPSLDSPGVTKGPRGEYIYSHIRRMAVVRQRKGYCICVPIYSYRQRGVTKNVGDDGAQAHAIVYSSRRKEPPAALPGEPDFEKKAIAVELADDQELGYASRIHFGKIHSIEWNIKVMTIGHVAQRSMVDFETYWKEELAR